jgi:putative ABC transport system permease protein
MPLSPGAPPDAGKGDGFVTDLFTDFKFALRTLAKAPGFTAIAVLSLALGIGPNTAVFSLVRSVIYQDWGVDDPVKIVDVYTFTRDGEYFYSDYPTFELVAENTTDVFESVAEHSLFTGRIESADGAAELVLGEMVSGNYFDVMGVQASRGRTFLPEEDATLETHPVVVLSDDFWRTHYASDESLVGSQIRLNGRPYTVIGIAPERFRGRIAPGIGTDFWVPFSMYPHLNPYKMTSGDLTITGRLRDGVPPSRAITAIQTLGARRDAELNALNPERRGRFALAAVSLANVKLHPSFDGILTRMSTLLFVAVGLVLLIACVNLAGFLLSRATDRRKEMAVRVAMGAGRGAILRQLLVEALTLAALGGSLGLALGQLAIRALTRVRPPIPLPLELEVGMDGSLVAFTIAITVLATVIFGLTPALEATRAPVAATLRDEAGSSGGRRTVGTRGLLVAIQMALSTVLLFGAVLFSRSLRRASELDLGFSTRQAAVVTVESGANEYTTADAAAFIEELERRLGARPAVGSLGITTRMPLDLGVSILSFDIPGVDPPPDQNRHRVEFTSVTPGYFGTMGIRLREGRDFSASDREGAQNVVILSQAAADRYWPGESAVGRVLYRSGETKDPLVVAGVVGNAKIWSLGEAPKPFAYLPFFQGNENTSFFVVATGTAPPAELAALVRDEARAIDPDIFLTSVETMDDHLGYVYFLPRIAAGLLALIGTLALVLACVGLYGMVSYGVSRRTREMGIRLALGAERGSVVGLVLRGGMTLVAAGGLAGLTLSVGLGQLTDRFLIGVTGLDPLALLAAPLLLGGVAAAAAYIPARRAARVDPVRALRSE